ncbi:MAG TPA: Hsp20/alpha crystallin family protein [Xanthomonadaceae bacterium]|nr:Hsp20/alpha crystallin family protein [Xanthomonadaceae bacterium]
MSLMTDLIPWTRNRGGDLQHATRDPFVSLQREINRAFDDIWRSFDVPLTRPGRGAFGAGFGWPNVELYENEKEVTLAAEVPGMSEKDLEIMLEDDALILRGERKSERNDTERQFTERYYGSFERRIPLPVEVQADKVEAKVRDGMLHVVLPKVAGAKPHARRIAVQHA